MKKNIISHTVLKNHDTIKYLRGTRIKSSSDVSPLNMTLWLWRNISAGEWKAIIVNFLENALNCSYCLDVIYLLEQIAWRAVAGLKILILQMAFIYVFI